jgi:hypothetical protein
MLHFNTLLAAAGIDPAQVRLLRHLAQVGGRSLLDTWHTDPETLAEYQALQPTNARASFARPYWASFIGTWDGRTVFVGLHRVLGRDELTETVVEPLTGIKLAAGTHDRYATERVAALDDYRGRLFVDWGGGTSGKRAWSQRADAQNKAITELRLSMTEDPFPGVMKINAPLSELASIPSSWAERLRDARGVYLLSCPRDGTMYVGSASGVGGFWARWSEYLANGHGGNVGLAGREPSDLLVTVVQVAGSGDTAEDIFAAEADWKDKLRTRTFGLNRN